MAASSPYCLAVIFVCRHYLFLYLCLDMYNICPNKAKLMCVVKISSAYCPYKFSIYSLLCLAM
jgi:hypothetical protein